MKEELFRLDKKEKQKAELLELCRLKKGDIWEDELSGHRVGCLDACERCDVERLMRGEKSALSIQDPPYNLAVFEKKRTEEYIAWSKLWVGANIEALAEDAALYIWLGADQFDGFSPLPEFMLMMRELPVRSRSFITLRNQRGYGTQQNWMTTRQELLYYVKGTPFFEVQYTDIPKILKGYYKKVGEKITENIERGKSENIRPGNVWVDIQQVFYRMRENVPGCYAQKPLKAIERIIRASSRKGDIVTDFFAHSGTTLIACETLGRKCYTMDIDPLFCEIAIRRLERFRKMGEPGWQTLNPFAE